MPPPPDPDRAARATLRRHRRIATGLLVLMAALAAGAAFLPPSWPAELLEAGARAGLVGGLADWFAVTALFRHPLGLPIPHTAIIPAQQRRLGEALGRFLTRHVVTEGEVARLMERFDVAGFLGRLLRDPDTAQGLARTLAALLPRLLAAVEDGRARRVLARLLPRLLGGAGAGRIVARALRTLVDGGRHQEVLGFVLNQLRDGMAAREDLLRAMIEDRVREQGGRLVGWALGASIASRVLQSVRSELDRMGPDQSELREAFDLWARREIDRMESDPERAAEIGRAIGGALSHDTVRAWTRDVWGRLRAALEADATRPAGHAATLLTAAIGNLGTLLETDPATRERLQRHGERLALSLLPSLQRELGGFVAGVIERWDTATLVERIELRVGRDLQYVRMNGTLVGFLVGVLIYAGVRLLFGQHVADF
jgi:uncharacterized membrane-anchored protein YjiN (DUF445 family)